MSAMKQKRWWAVLMLREVVWPTSGEIGFIPVFRTKREAQKVAGKKYQVRQIARAA